MSGVSIKEMFCGLCLVGVLLELLSFGSAAVSKRVLSSALCVFRGVL